MSTNGYRYVKRKHHPLSTSSGLIPEHRVVLYDKIGPGPHACHWECGRMVDWAPGQRTRGNALVVDHVDCDRANNAPDNLVPSCHACNLRRYHDAQMSGRLTIVENGRRQAATERTCQNDDCGKAFLVATKYLGQAGRRTGLYCCRGCMYAGRPNGRAAG